MNTDDFPRRHGQLNGRRPLVLGITHGILLCVAGIGLLLFFFAAAADPEFETPDFEAHRALVTDVLLRATLFWLMPGGVAWLLLWRRETRFISPWLVLLGELAIYGALSYVLFAGIWPRLP